MNSKYAPIAALTVLLILVIVALGWFLAIKPRLAEAADIRTQTEEVDQNITQIQLATSKLTEYEQNFAALPSIDETVALNLPSRLDMTRVRERITDAAEGAKVTLIELSTDASYPVDGWEMPANARVSYSIAQLFSKGPVHAPASQGESAPAPTPAPAEGEQPTNPGEYQPVVTADAKPGPVVTSMQGVPIKIRVAGSYDQVVAFLRELASPGQQLFLIYQLEQDARNAGESSEPGVPDPKDGDVMMTLTGAFYLLNVDSSVVDDDPAETVRPSSRSPFAPSTPVK